ncbi:unnamed protein product, partial [Polarella glacialis]
MTGLPPPAWAQVERVASVYALLQKAKPYWSSEDLCKVHGKLAKVNVTDAESLARAVLEGGLNASLSAAGEKKLKSSTLAQLKMIVREPCRAKQLEDESSQPIAKRRCFCGNCLLGAPTCEKTESLAPGAGGAIRARLALPVLAMSPNAIPRKLKKYGNTSLPSLHQAEKQDTQYAAMSRISSEVTLPRVSRGSLDREESPRVGLSDLSVPLRASRENNNNNDNNKTTNNNKNNNKHSSSNNNNNINKNNSNNNNKDMTAKLAGAANLSVARPSASSPRGPLQRGKAENDLLGRRPERPVVDPSREAGFAPRSFGNSASTFSEDFLLGEGAFAKGMAAIVVPDSTGSSWGARTLARTVEWDDIASSTNGSLRRVRLKEPNVQEEGAPEAAAAWFDVPSTSLVEGVNPSHTSMGRWLGDEAKKIVQNIIRHQDNEKSNSSSNIGIDNQDSKRKAQHLLRTTRSGSIACAPNWPASHDNVNNTYSINNQRSTSSDSLSFTAINTTLSEEVADSIRQHQPTEPTADSNGNGNSNSDNGDGDGHAGLGADSDGSDDCNAGSGANKAQVEMSVNDILLDSHDANDDDSNHDDYDDDAFAFAGSDSGTAQTYSSDGFGSE